MQNGVNRIVRDHDGRATWFTFLPSECTRCPAAYTSCVLGQGPRRHTLAGAHGGMHVKHSFRLRCLLSHTCLWRIRSVRRCITFSRQVAADAKAAARVFMQATRGNRFTFLFLDRAQGRILGQEYVAACICMCSMPPNSLCAVSLGPVGILTSFLPSP